MKMKTLRIQSDDIFGPWVTPPKCAGQIVVTSYARTEDCILVRTEDRSARSIKIEAHKFPVRGEFAPQNSAPKLGRRIGLVVIV